MDSWPPTIVVSGAGDGAGYLKGAVLDPERAPGGEALVHRAAACPACGVDREFRVVYSRNGIPIGRCPGCGLGRSDVAGFQPDEYYTESYFAGGRSDGYADYQASADVLRGEFRRTLGHLLSLGIQGGHLLEVGCAYGYFLDEARDRFQVSGIEISEAAAAAARVRHADVRTGPLDEATLAGLSDLDAIVLLDVIEHLEDPGRAVALCSERLRPGGVLLITTGDWGSLVARALGSRWRLMTPPQHLWFFTRGSLARLAGNQGLTEVSVSHPWKHVPLPLVAFQLQRMLFGRTSRGRWIPNVGIPVNLFDAMRMTFRRT